MNDLRKMSTAELEAMVRETEECLGDIRSELARRREKAQHHAIDNLDLNEAKVNWADVKAFFHTVLQELRR